VTKSRVSQRPLWLIAKQDEGRMEVLTLNPHSEEEALPIFSHEEETEAFLGLQAPGKGWRARKTTTGELVSLLYGLCTSIEKAILDPLPVAVDVWMVVDLTGPGRENFLRNVLGVDETSFTNQRERVRRNGKERGRTENGDARRGGALNGASEGSDDYIPDYVMRDFIPSDDSCGGYEARPRVSEVLGEDLMPRHE
jgi:hypothetical protein